MQCFTELIPPTAVTDALCLPFTSATANNLIVVKTSLLQIFSFKTVSTERATDLNDNSQHGDQYHAGGRRELNTESLEHSFLGADVILQRTERSQSTKLVLEAEYPLSGIVTAIARVRILESKSGGEAVLIAFKDAKLSLVEWDPECHGMSTISIHYYEREDLQRNPFAPDLSQDVNVLTVDPSSRCAALKFGARHLAILPFRQAGDDLVMEDYDDSADREPEVNGNKSENAFQPPKKANGEPGSHQTPYMSSFVLPITVLDSTLIHPIHLSFLYEYREPTFGVLSAPHTTSTSLLHERRDALCYSVFTLDLEQRASTAILSVAGLPYDLYRAIALPSPVGGALLIGGNELVHVDQAGKTSAVAVNTFARECSSFTMMDQSGLGMRLEGCEVELLGKDSGDMLLILNTGELAIVAFRLDGRSVSGFSVRRVGRDGDGSVLKGSSSCAVNIGRGKLFVGSEDTDSVVLSWIRKGIQASKQASILGLESDIYDEQDEMEDLDDDLYSGADSHPQQPSNSLPSAERSSNGTDLEDYTFRVDDSLINLAPMADLAFGKEPSPRVEGNTQLESFLPTNLDLVTSRGHQRSGGLTVLTKKLEPVVIGSFDFPEAQDVWSVRAKRPTAKGILPQSNGKDKPSIEGDYSLSNEYDRIMVVSKSSVERGEESAVYALTPTGFEEMKDTEFDPSAGGTVDVGTLGDGMRVVQVLKSEVRSYDGDLGLAQIYPMTDEASGAEPKIISASFADPYVLLVRDDRTILILVCDESGDLEEVESGSVFSSKEWISGSLYADSEDVFALPRTNASSDPVKKITLGFLLTVDGGLEIRGTQGDLTLYKPFQTFTPEQDRSISATLQFIKSSNLYLPEPDGGPKSVSGMEDHLSLSPMRRLADVCGYSTVFVPGSSPCFILKTASTIPKAIGLQGEAVKGMSGFHTGGCEKGWVHIDVKGLVRVSRLPDGVRYTETGWSTKTVDLGEEVQALAYHEPTATYAVATSTIVDFDLPKEDDYHKEWAKENTSFKPQVEQGSVKLINPSTWSVVDTYALQPYEVALCVETLSLETSELTHARSPLIAVGTCHTLVTDLPCRGCIYVFEIITVVPEPGRPETDRKLKLVAKEDVKGAVTALSEIGSQGFLLAAQGQKCMVRGLKEDGTLLPVAFMDVMCHVSVAKALPGTGMTLLADAVKGAWFVGYTEEPYKMVLFGKSTSELEVLAGDFLPHDRQLYIVVADADCNLHILQYDPEHPKSLNGNRLLHRTVFHTGQFPSTLTRIPNDAPASSSDSPAAQQQALLHTSTTGALSVLTPLSEPQYRRLSSLQSALANLLDHPCGLNPRSFRAPSGAAAINTLTGYGSDGLGGGRGVLDAGVLSRWWELGTGRRAEAAARAGVRGEEVLADLEAVSGKLNML
ncbi:MAG: hypothetical protein M4579_003244 [Chaenotheca gracillima]|nr:MAG: hypothetical protein M4579_003244 [Chaenotheca gracillima]